MSVTLDGSVRTCTGTLHGSRRPQLKNACSSLRKAVREVRKPCSASRVSVWTADKKSPFRSDMAESRQRKPKSRLMNDTTCTQCIPGIQSVLIDTRHALWLGGVVVLRPHRTINTPTACNGGWSSTPSTSAATAEHSRLQRNAVLLLLLLCTGSGVFFRFLKKGNVAKVGRFPQNRASKMYVVGCAERWPVYCNCCAFFLRNYDILVSFGAPALRDLLAAW